MIDAHLPRSLALRLIALGHEATHTLDLPAGNRTSDHAIAILADEIDAVVVTKDADFVVNHALTHSPRHLLVIAKTIAKTGQALGFGVNGRSLATVGEGARRKATPTRGNAG